MKQFLLDLLFPKFCLGCKREGSYLCEDCRSLLDITQFYYCLCSRNHQTIPPNEKYGKCSRCQNKKLSGLYFALPYKEGHITKKLIYKFKYKPYLKDLAKTLAGILIEHFIITQKNTDAIWKNSVLVPVPLDKKKIKIRGYNQSEELAKELSKVLQVPIISDVLIKTKITSPQMELKKEAREKNLLGAFAVSDSSVIASEVRPLGDERGNPESIKNKKIFLVDDVYTTGCTMEECARVLRDAGAKSVWGIAI